MARPSPRQFAQGKDGGAGLLFEDLSFDAQQAVEKAIKAVFVALGVAFPYVHDLARLLALLEHEGEKVPVSVEQAKRLTTFAIVTRYPGAVEVVTEEDYRRAVAIAEAVVAWAEERIGKGWGDPGG